MLCDMEEVESVPAQQRVQRAGKGDKEGRCVEKRKTSGELEEDEKGEPGE